MTNEPGFGLRSAHLEVALLVAALIGLVTGAAAWSIGAEDAATAAWFATTVLGIVPAVGSVISAARHRRLGADVIALAALVGALAVGEVLAGAIITLMLASGRAIEARAAARAQRDLGALVGRAPRTVQRIEGDTLRDVAAETITPGELLMVRPGEVLAVDGRVEGGAAVLDEAEDTELYPALARVFGGDDTTGTMSRGHAEIAHLTHRLGRVLDDVDDDRLEGEDATDVLRLLYGLHAVLTLHFSQEDESYLSLAET